MADLKISQLIQLTAPDGTEQTEVIVNPFTPGTNRRVITKTLVDNIAIVPSAASGVSIQFDKPRTYGTIASPESGNITKNSSSAVVGMVQLLIHSLYNSTPTFGAEFVLLSDYTPSEVNFIYMELLDDGNILTSIRTEI